MKTETHGKEISGAQKAKPSSEKENTETTKCNDRYCPVHGEISARGKSFTGKVIKIFPKRAVIEFQRIVKYPKYERFAKSTTKIHAHLSDCMKSQIKIGDIVKATETRRISKIKHSVVIEKIR